MTSPRRGSVKRPGERADPRTGGGKDLELYTLGGVRLLRQGVDETSKLGAKHLALLVYLFHERRPMHPSEVIELLGRGQDEEKEVEALKRVITWLRENVPGVGVRLTADTIEALGGLRLDTREVDSAIDGGDAACVADLYGGDFLEGFQSGASAFDEWAQKERGRIRRAWSHAILTAAQKAENQARWKVAAQWWEILVARAPMRPEAVVGLLRAYAQSGEEQEAARVYSEYLATLRQSGIAQPAEAVQHLIDRHPKLRQIAAKAPPPAEAAFTVQPPTQPGAPPTAPPKSEPKFATAPPPPPPRAAPRERDRPSETRKAEPEIVAGFQPGAAPPIGADEAVAPDQDDAWREIVDMTTEDEVDLSVAEVPEAPEAPRAKPPDSTGDFTLLEAEKPSAPQPGPTAKPRPRRTRDSADEVLREAAKAAVDEFAGVRHEVTSVRKAWGPALRDAWQELAPWREVAKERAASGLERAAAGAVMLPRLLGQFLQGAGRFIWRVIRSLAALGRPFKAARRGPGKVAAHARRRRPRAKAAPVRARPRPAPPRAAPAPKPVEPLPKPVEPPARPVAPPAMPSEAVPTFLEPTVRPVEPAAEPAQRARKPVEPVAGPVEALAKPFEVVARPRKRKRARRSGLRLVRRYWYAAVALALVGLGITFGPDLVARIGRLRTDLPEVRAPSLPRVSLPRVSLRTPAFVETSISRIGRMFSGPLLEESGQWILLADVEVNEEARGDYPPTAMTVALEAELTQARFFSVVPRERALIARRSSMGSASENLPNEDAVALAQAEGYAAVIVARLSRAAGVDSAAVRVLSRAGEELYGVAAEVSGEASGLETLIGLTRPVRRRLGEPQEDVEASLPATQVLSGSPPALDAYARGRMHLFAGRYSETIAAAQEATRHDSDFAMAYRLLAEAYALSGQRTLARSALDSAYRLSERASERERMRILADRHAWDGRYSDAAVTYEQVFQLYRDDVGALKSLALLQRIIGVRGGGEGNLRVAYTIDPYDWPPLSRVARYLGYSGRLPDLDSLVAAIEGSP